MRLLGSRALAWFMALYAVALLLLAGRISPWLDEILTLIGVYQPGMPELMEYIRGFSGGTPLTFLVPRAITQVFGESLVAARLPSIAAVVLSYPAIFLFARRMGLRYPFLAVLVFALWPLTIRYGLEVRPYAFALGLGIWATELFLQWRDSPTPWRFALYVLAFVTGGLAQPYVLSLAGAHLVWSFFHHRRLLRLPIAAIISTILALAPWYAHFREGWRAVNEAQHLSAWSWISLQGFFHEIAGSGYFGTAVLLAGVGFGLRKAGEPRGFWIALAAVPLVAAPMANYALYYFFAIRQVIYILPAMALLFTAGVEAFPRYGRCLAIAFLIASLYSDVKWFIRPRENWQAASDAVAREAQRGACVMWVAESHVMYTFYHPELRARECKGDAERVVVAGTPYEAGAAYPRVLADLQARGLSKQSEHYFDGPRVEVFSK